MTRISKKEYELRVTACSLIVAIDNADKIEQIMSDLGIDELTAGRMYVNGALRNSVSRGETANRIEALEKFEFSQVQDRYAVPKTINTIAKTVRHFNTLTGKAYLKSIDNGKTFIEVLPVKNTASVSHAKKWGKVYGSLYTQWQENEEKLDPASVFEYSIYEQLKQEIDIHAGAYMHEYISRLSKTGRAWVNVIKNATMEDIKYTMSAKGKEDDKTRKVHRAIEYMVHDFPIDTIGTMDYIELVRKYA